MWCRRVCRGCFFAGVAGRFSWDGNLVAAGKIMLYISLLFLFQSLL
jgi:hypothetical protein